MAKTGKGKSKKKVKKTAKTADKRKVKKEVKEDENFRGIVRLADNDLDGHLKLSRALLHVKGIGHSLVKPISYLIEEKLKISPETQIGTLSEDQLEKINSLLYSLDDSEIPSFMVNRRKDYATGKNVHLIMNELLFALRQDIEAKIKKRSWQGYRHAVGKKVRGQRTKNTGRRGLTVGVIRSKDKK